MTDKSSTTTPTPPLLAPEESDAIPGRAAAQQATDADHLIITLPIVGEIVLPAPAQLAYYGGVAALLALEIIDWPLALIIAAGHALTHQQNHRNLEEFGQALEDIN